MLRWDIAPTLAARPFKGPRSGQIAEASWTSVRYKTKESFRIE